MHQLAFNRSKKNYPVIGAGGGACTNTFAARTVLKANEPAGRYELKNPIFIRTRGDLCNSQEQAIIPLDVGDIIVHMRGTLPADDANPDAVITAEKVVRIDDGADIAHTEVVPVTFENVPVLAIRGAEKYHNRDGRFFCRAGEE